jgi:DNA modification methylase
MHRTELEQPASKEFIAAIQKARVWDPEAFSRFVNAARDKGRVSGLTHKFYRYPARFSPQFVRTAIEQFTCPGDLVFDPFMGGGTTLVEAIALGRRAIGSDISSLATFVSEAKTLIFSDNELDHLERWVDGLSKKINIHLPSISSISSIGYSEAGYYKHLGSNLTWRLRKAMEQALASAMDLPTKRVETFARCVVLRTGQWALDGRKQLPNVAQFRETIGLHAAEMLKGSRELRTATNAYAAFAPTATCLNQSIVGLDKQNPCNGISPKLVLTSPPYPGVHVLYHRWQVDGRKETAAPFWIANKLDGSGAAYYTLGDRHAKDNWTYFEGLRSALTSIAHICNEDTTIVQVVAFTNPARQLPRYLEVAEEAGLSEIITPFVSGKDDGRLWRAIPNRKWHAGQLGDIPASQEVVLFHRKSTPR